MNLFQSKIPNERTERKREREREREKERERFFLETLIIL